MITKITPVTTEIVMNFLLVKTFMANKFLFYEVT